MHSIISPKEANQQGLSKYYTGVPCVNGHVAFRLVSTRRCTDCNRLNTSSQEKSEYNKEYYVENRDRLQQIGSTYRLNNKNKKAQYDRQYSKLNLAKINARRAKYRAAKLQRSVQWDLTLTEFICNEAYELAKLRKQIFGFEWEVDHVIPLQGEAVSGLHVWNNLAVIPATINSSKSNKYDDTTQTGCKE
jgi:hypothetical protein